MKHIYKLKLSQFIFKIYYDVVFLKTMNNFLNKSHLPTYIPKVQVQNSIQSQRKQNTSWIKRNNSLGEFDRENEQPHFIRNRRKNSYAKKIFLIKYSLFIYVYLPNMS